MIGNGYTAFQQTVIQLEVHFDKKYFRRCGSGPGELPGDDQEIPTWPFSGRATSRREQNQLYARWSARRCLQTAEHGAAGSAVDRHDTSALWVPADDDVDMLMKGNIDIDQPESSRRISDKQLSWISSLKEAGRIKLELQYHLLYHRRFPGAGTGGNPGSSQRFFLYPVDYPVPLFSDWCGCSHLSGGIRTRPPVWTDLIEVNINNLAAVPSIIFGLLGLAILSISLGFHARPRWSAGWF